MARNRKRTRPSKTSVYSNSNQKKQPASENKVPTIAKALPHHLSATADDDIRSPSPARRQKTSKSTWTDGDDEPRFASPPPPSGRTAELSDNTQSSEHAKTKRKDASNVSLLSIVDVLPERLHSLLEEHDIRCIRIMKNTKIRDKVRATLSHFPSVDKGPATETGTEGKKRAKVALLVAPAEAANKLVSVLEVAKRELEENNAPRFQYTAVIGRPAKVENRNSNLVQNQDDEMDEDDGFEPMDVERRLKLLEGRTIRPPPAPILAVYLSDVQILELKSTYGEQAYAGKPGR